jgi:hypothetical protein
MLFSKRPRATLIIPAIALMPSLSLPKNIPTHNPHSHSLSFLPAPAAARRLRGYGAGGVEVAEAPLDQARPRALAPAGAAARGSWRGRWRQGMRGGGGGVGYGVLAGEEGG